MTKQTAPPTNVGSTAGVGVMSSGAPEVEACIEAVMAEHPTVGGRADLRYYEAVHQELAPLARKLERRAAEAMADAAEMQRLRAENAELRTMLTRYRLEVPLGNQPHMLAHAVDVALGRA